MRYQDRDPTLEEFEAMAERAYGELPEAFREAAGRIVLHVQDVADDEVLRELGIDEPLHLSGLYHGVALIHESVTFPSPDTPAIFLYRRSILAEWRARGDITLEDLISHVVVHELGHHFGYSDEEMDAILDEAAG